MANDVTGFGAVVNLIASNTYQNGISLSQFADDVDPFDLPSQKVGDATMGVNGDLITWSRASPVKTNIAVIQGSDDDQNLSILLQANTPVRGKSLAYDIITITVAYPDGTLLTLANGKITDGMPGASLASSGRLKSKVYMFSFESRSGSGV
jgi:hypothetical protein